MDSCVLDCELDYEDDYSFDSDSDETIENPNQVISFLGEVEPIIKQCIKNYFCDKKDHNGKKISSSLLELPYYTSLVLNTTVSDGVVKAYFLMEENNFLLDVEDSIGEDVRYMIDLIRDIQRIIPQEFVGGMILMYLELVEGIEIW